MWKNVDPEFDKWTVEEYKKGLEHPSSEIQEAELMYKLFDLVSDSLEEINKFL